MNWALLCRSGAGTVDLCWVAAGMIEAFYRPGLKIWDFAAAQLIATESGAHFAPASGLGAARDSSHRRSRTRDRASRRA
ncbi:inositol monophosphatase family protein [Arthrobacter sp. 2MCAF14]|uniref:inositol monophosphatase family protein n=1 Tax=Arthrobacter sp. 2MCAF14 TaxID=3232982 RepID=UPI003F90DA11